MYKPVLKETKTGQKTLPTTLFLGMFLVALAMPSWAGRYELITKKIPGQSYQYGDVTGVCRAYEKNLNRFSNIPYGMACERQLDPTLGFIRPKWEKLDVMQHAVLVSDIFKFLHWDRNLAPDSRPWEEQLKDMIAPHKPGGRYPLVMELMRVDLNRDGKLENLVRIGDERPCDPEKVFRNVLPQPQKQLVVVDGSLTKIDSDFSHYVFRPSGGVFMYQGYAYSETFHSEPEQLRSKEEHDAILILHPVFARGAAGAECRFYYHDTNSAK